MLLLLAACSHDPRCPEEMALVGQGPGAFCIDRWEAHLVDPAGNPMPHPPANGGIVVGTQASIGVLPTTAITFLEARAACAATPATLDGDTYAQKHLATEAEWTDAADGTVGKGGRKWPWGDTYEADRCNTVQGTGNELGKTGDRPRCVSVEGVYDQVGNAFEWVDPGLTMDIAASLRRYHADGIEIDVEPDGALSAPATLDLRRLHSFATAVDYQSLHRDDAGHLWMTVSGGIAAPKGFLTIVAAEEHEVTAMLPVSFRPLAGTNQTQLFLWKEGDGLPIPEKIGGAWYAGANWPDGELNHTADFRGTIGFRCAATPG